jgi:hypothetical protein
MKNTNSSPVDIEELSLDGALRHLKVKSIKLLIAWGIALITISFGIGYRVARFFEDHDTTLTKARIEQVQKERDALREEIAEVRSVAAQKSGAPETSLCRVSFESVKWEADKFALRLCIYISSQNVCLPQSQVTFDDVPPDYSSSFWVPCADSYSYGLSWVLFSRSEHHGLVEEASGSTNEIQSLMNGETVRTSVPYFPQIVFTVGPDQRALRQTRRP